MLLISVESFIRYQINLWEEGRKDKKKEWLHAYQMAAPAKKDTPEDLNNFQHKTDNPMGWAVYKDQWSTDD